MLTNEGKAADKPGETKTGELEAGDEWVYFSTGAVHQ